MNPKSLFKKAAAEKRNNLTYLEARELLNYYNIPLARGAFVKTLDEALTASRKIGYPVAIKVVSPNILHKTDVGGVVLNVNNDDELKKAFESISKNVRKKLPKAKIEGMVVEKMVSGQEVIVGGKEDPTFGKVLMFGLGGIFTELFNDVSFRLIPVSRKDCIEMIEEIQGYKILSGYRGKKYNIDSIVNVLLKTSKLLEENNDIKELDINPLVVTETNSIVVDARIII
jgi:acetyl-CoA synthetase (ADP-forming)